MKTADPSRPVLLNLGQGVAWDGWYGRGRRTNHPEDYAAYLKGCDIASFDIYPANHESKAVGGNLWFVARGVERLRTWTGDQKPIWACIECTHIRKSGHKPTPTEVRAEVWMALIHRADGLIYFVHQFEPKFIEAALLEDSKMLATVTGLNQQITELAPVLNSPTITNTVTVTVPDRAVPVATMVKRFNGQTYLFAVAMRGEPIEATFTLKNGSPAANAEVLGEKRSLAITNGMFTDRFAAWDVHLYRVH
jgi:Zn ribbon nucleic-acid-binding protein